MKKTPGIREQIDHLVTALQMHINQKQDQLDIAQNKIDDLNTAIATLEELSDLF